MIESESTVRPAAANPAPPTAEPVAEPPAKGGFPWGWLIAAVLIAGLVFVKIKYFPSNTAGGKGGAGGGKGAAGAPGGKGGAAQKLPVKAYVVAPTRLSDEVAATGSVLAEEAVTLKAEIAGKITTFTIREGQPVRKGQLLFSINAADIQAQLQKQRYNLKLYQDQEKRQRTLLEKEYISAQEYEQANNQLLTARAEQQALEADLAKAYVRAPFDGVLGLTSATVGTYVSPGTTITTLSRVRPVKIDFAVPGRYATSVRVGDTVRVTDEASNRKLSATVYAVNPQIDPVSRTLSVRARYANAKDELRPGAFVKVNLQLGQTDEAIQIPTESVVPVATGYQVFKVVQGKAVAQDVKIGIRSERLIQITSGLANGDTILRTGVQQVKAGDAVKVTGT
jgi:membrane fusion protein, multidrug efflux system